MNDVIEMADYSDNHVFDLDDYEAKEGRYGYYKGHDGYDDD